MKKEKLKIITHVYLGTDASAPKMMVFNKVHETIRTCKPTKGQLDTCDKLVNNFKSMYEDEVLYEILRDNLWKKLKE